MYHIQYLNSKIEGKYMGNDDLKFYYDEIYKNDLYISTLMDINYHNHSL